MICVAKPRYTAAAAREHWRVLAPRLPTPGTHITSLVHTPREVLFEIFQRRVLNARIKGKERYLKSCKFLTKIESILEPLGRLTHFIQSCLMKRC